MSPFNLFFLVSLVCGVSLSLSAEDAALKTNSLESVEIRNAAYRKMILHVSDELRDSSACIFIDVATNELYSITNLLSSLPRYVTTAAFAKLDRFGVRHDTITNRKGVLLQVGSIRKLDGIAETDCLILYARGLSSLYDLSLERSTNQWVVRRVRFKVGS